MGIVNPVSQVSQGIVKNRFTDIYLMIAFNLSYIDFIIQLGQLFLIIACVFYIISSVNWIKLGVFLSKQIGKFSHRVWLIPDVLIIAILFVCHLCSNINQSLGVIVCLSRLLHPMIIAKTIFYNYICFSNLHCLLCCRLELMRIGCWTINKRSYLSVAASDLFGYLTVKVQAGNYSNRLVSCCFLIAWLPISQH